MALWLVRAGRHGEGEENFFGNQKIYMGWTQLEDEDLSDAISPADVLKLLKKHDPDQPPARLQNWSRQIAAFSGGMEIGDWVAVPRKTKAAIAIGEITGRYQYDPKVEGFLRHSRQVRWLTTDAPRSAFDPDILQSLSALMTICRIQRHEAEARVRAMAKRQWMSGPALPAATKSRVLEGIEATDTSAEPAAEDDIYDLERTARDQIATLIERRFTGHGLAELVEAVLAAQGYTTHRSPPGPDGGVDIVAGTVGCQRKSGTTCCIHSVDRRFSIQRIILLLMARRRCHWNRP